MAAQARHSLVYPSQTSVGTFSTRTGLRRGTMNSNLASWSSRGKEITAEKKLLLALETGHNQTPETTARMNAFVEETLKRK